ncbi:MAG TPA: molybdate ABC transporter substrate-binding protein [Kofleriaceae bacterium]|nr:molybdate ABC transporter substrate-binding protein [Kofleriaceae bacterium]
MRTRIFILLLLATTACGHKKKGVVRVAAAANLTEAFKEMTAAFTRKEGIEVDVIPGSSGQLAQKISEDAPYDVFFAANVGFTDDVIKSGDCDEASKKLYARGKIVMWSKGEVPAALTGLPATSGKIAIANPDHAPYGKAAKQAMEAAGVWDQVKDRIVYGNNIEATLELAQTGNAPIAFVALSLVLNDKSGHYAAIDESTYKPLDQAVVVCSHGRAKAGGQKFVDFVMSPDGREIMKRYGFALPGE